MKFVATIFAGAACLVSMASAHAACSIEGSGNVSTLSNSFPVLEIIAAEMRSCSNASIKVTTKLTTDNEAETSQALKGTSSPYGLVALTNSSIAPLQAAGALRPLNDFVAKYKAKYNIEDGMLIKIGSDVMAIAFQVNAQHLFYRKDVLDAAHIAVPTNYDEVVAAAEKLKGNPAIEFPLGGTYKSGWNLAEEFINNYLGTGAELLKANSVEPAFTGPEGVKTMELMKTLIGFMSPNALALDTAATTQQLQQGKVAMVNMWASRAAAMDDPKSSTVVGKIEFAAAPALAKGGTPATTLWWDGLAIPKNFDGNPEIAFQVMMEGLKESVVLANNDSAIWLRSVYKPTRFALGSAASARAGSPPYPMAAQQSLVHNALANHIGDYFAGKASAEKALADAADDYRVAAKAKGLMK